MEQKEKINLEEIEKELGKQLLPEDFYFAVILDPEIPIPAEFLEDGEEEKDDDEDYTTYTVWIAEKKAWDNNKTLLESPVYANSVPSHSYVIQLIESTEKIDHLFGTSFTTDGDSYKSIEEIKTDVESLGFTYLPELEEVLGVDVEDEEPDHSEVFEELRDGDEDLYKKIVEVYEKCKEEKLKTDLKGKENYATDVPLPKEIVEAVDKTLTPEDRQRWDIEDQLYSLNVYTWQGNLYIVVDGCFDCDLLTLPIEAIKLVLDHLATYTPETLPLGLAS